MSSPMYCTLCQRNVVPVKKFNWLVFIFLCACFYLPFYWMQSKKCPICQGEAFGPAQAEKITPAAGDGVAAPAAPGTVINLEVAAAAPAPDPAPPAQVVATPPPIAAGSPTTPGKALFCTNCGTKSAAGAMFCAECGQRLQG